jgi:cell filamentation protein, protein adenylyltransferase
MELPMFKPKYQISEALLANIRRAAELFTELRHRPMSKVVRAELVKRAVTLSAHTSTSIEGNILPLTEVKQLLKNRPGNLRVSEREVLNYNDALEALNHSVQEGKGVLNMASLLEIHGKVMHGLEEAPFCGHFRELPVVVNDPGSGKTVYLPPDHGDVTGLVRELMDFINHERKRIDPLILAALFHRQLVLVHPFVDGNGRTTRLATKLLLAELGIDTFHVFSFENYYNRNISRYFREVGSEGDYYDLRDTQDFSSWLEYFTEGIVDELLRVLSEIAELGNKPQASLEEHHRKILSQLDKHGFITDKDYSCLTKRAKATRTLDFKKLLNLGLITRHGKGKNTHYRLSSLTTVLDDAPLRR